MASSRVQPELTAVGLYPVREPRTTQSGLCTS